MADSGGTRHSAHRVAASYDELVTRIAGGDEDAFAELYDRICPQVLKLVQRFRVDDLQVEQLVYGIFLEIWRTAPLMDATSTTAAAWILSLAHDHATAVVRRDEDAASPAPGPDACTHAARPGAQVPVAAGAPHGLHVTHAEEWDHIVRDFLAH